MNPYKGTKVSSSYSSASTQTHLGSLKSVHLLFLLSLTWSEVLNTFSRVNAQLKGNLSDKVGKDAPLIQKQNPTNL